MKVYVVKNKYNKQTNGYMTETGEFINSIWQAELFNDYETAKCYAPALCQVVECELMETTELSKHDKQVRKEVCEEITELAKNEFEFLICDECYNTIDKDVYISSVALTEILDQIQSKDS